MSELRGLGGINDKLHEIGVEVVPISVDPPEVSRQVVQGHDLPFDILCDTDLTVIDRYGLRHEGAAPDGSDVTLPALVLISRDGRILWHFVPSRIQGRMSPPALLKTLRKQLGQT